jgi:hypothetical protein
MKLDVSTVLPISPLRLHQEYRDYWGEPQARLAERIDAILKSGRCYRPRWYHAPDTEAELIGVDGNGYLEYILYIPAGSWIIAWAHAQSVATSSFVAQITDVGLDYTWFNVPAEDAFFTNPGATAAGPLRLLTTPYPVAPPGHFRIQFWNQSANNNPLVQLSFLVLEPDPDFSGDKDSI